MNPRLRDIKPKGRRAIFMVLLMLTLLIMVVLNITGRTLINESAPQGIISYELAGNEETAQRILDSWDEMARTYAGFNLGFDYLFLILYSTTIAFAILWLNDLLQIGRGKGRIALILAFSLPIAAILDAIENAALLTMLVKGVSSPWPQVSLSCATAKFGLVFLSLAYVLAGFLAYLWISRIKDT